MQSSVASEPSFNCSFSEKERKKSKEKVDITLVISELVWLEEGCELRCLDECSRWCSELLCHMSLADVECADTSAYYRKSTIDVDTSLQHHTLICFARKLIRNREYRRAKYFLDKVDCSTPVEKFLYYFSWYMASLQSRLQNDASDCDTAKEGFTDTMLGEIRRDLDSLKEKHSELFDCFLNYLHGIVLKECNELALARSAFHAAVEQDYRCWPAWEALSKVSDIFYSVKMEKEHCGTKWQCQLFIGETLFRLQLFLCAIDAYMQVSNYLGATPYILCQIASAQSDLQEHESSIKSFHRVRKMDPYRIEQMSFFSDSLYIRQSLVELANLAKFFFESHKYNWETCCIVANYYSARKGHEMAQSFLKRAIRINPSNTSIWVLLGHEYMETKNHQFAVTAYRRATVIDPLCYRAWYGLGQLYEILKLPAYSLYYYQQAHKCKPADSRILIALGVVFSKLSLLADAEKCFKKAFQIGDVEGNALTNLASLYEQQGDKAMAARAYEAYLNIYTEDLLSDFLQVAVACQFLAKYYLTADDLDKAYTYAQKCLNFSISKEEGTRMLRTIANLRMQKQQLQKAGAECATTSSKQLLSDDEMPKRRCVGASRKPSSSSSVLKASAAPSGAAADITNSKINTDASPMEEDINQMEMNEEDEEDIEQNSDLDDYDDDLMNTSDDEIEISF